MTDVCKNHSDVEAVDVCSVCGEGFCENCLITLRGKLLCGECKVSVIQAEERGERINVEYVLTPWERREELGWWQGFYQTIKTVIMTPTKFFQETNPQTNNKEDVKFAVYLYSIVMVLGLPFSMLMIFGMDALTGNSQDADPLKELFGITTLDFQIWAQIIGALLGPVFAIIMIYVGSGLMHLSLKLVSGASEGFAATRKGVCYGLAPISLSFIPIVGMVSLYYIYTTFIGFREMHGSTTNRTLAAYAVAFGIYMFICMLFVILIVAGAFVANGTLGAL